MQRISSLSTSFNSMTVLTSSSSCTSLPSLKKSKVIYFVRHAEAAHNILEKQAIEDAIAQGILSKEEQEQRRRAVLNNEDLKDAPLSEEGISQVMRKSRSLTMLNQLGGSKFAPPSLVLVSPLRRALMTATELFWNTNPHNRPKFVALEILREKRTGFAADERLSRKELELEFPHVDFTDLTEDADANDPTRTRKKIQKGETNEQVRERGRLFLEDILTPLAYEEDTPSIALVSHKGWLREFRQTLRDRQIKGELQVQFDLDDWHQTLYRNAEVRVAEFEWEGNELKSIVSKSVESALSSILMESGMKRKMILSQTPTNSERSATFLPQIMDSDISSENDDDSHEVDDDNEDDVGLMI